MGNIGSAAVAIVGGLIGLAILAVIVSQRANTANVLKSAGSALGTVIGAAVGPVTGSSGNTFGSSLSNLGALA